MTDFVFGSRFKHIPELQRMGANIRVEGRSAIVQHSVLNGAQVQATDLRGGAALVIAALMVPHGGITEITGYEYILRGYESLIENLSQLGATVWLEPEVIDARSH